MVNQAGRRGAKSFPFLWAVNKCFFLLNNIQIKQQTEETSGNCKNVFINLTNEKKKIDISFISIVVL